MAAINDWIKVEKSTARKPEVLMLAGILGIHPDHAFGLCVRFWFWVDDQMSSRNCRAIVAQVARQDGDNTLSRFCRAFVALDSVIGHVGFGAAMVEIGWIEVEESEHGVEIVIPNVDRHLSKTAKNRAENTSRQRFARVAQMSRKCRAKSATRERERERVEEEEPPRVPPKFSPSKNDDEPIEALPITDLAPKSDALPIGDIATPIDDLNDKRPKTLPDGQNAADAILCNPVTNGVNTASTVGELVSLWCHFCRRPGNSAQRALPVLDELVRQGISIESIRLAIIDPARDRTEAIWTFSDRLTASKKPAAAPVDFGAEVAAMIRQNQAAKRAST